MNELKKRRDQLRQKQSRDEQRKDKEAFLAALDAQKINYEIFWEGDAVAQQALEKFPITSYGTLDLGKLKDTFELPLTQVDELKNKNLGNPEVFMVWSFGPSLDLKTSFDGVINNINLLTENSDDFFVVCPDEKWCLMFHHDEKLLFGRLGEGC